MKDIPENAFLVPARALRDEGTSFHYMEPGRYVETDSELRKEIEKIFVESRNYKRDPIGFVAELARVWKLST